MSCFRINRDRELSVNSEHADTLDLRYERTIASTYRLRKEGYLMTEKWECVFDREMGENREMREFLHRYLTIENAPLNPRDAFYGGRTGNVVTPYEITGMEKIRYVDVCSLYPFVLKTVAFPSDIPWYTSVRNVPR